MNKILLLSILTLIMENTNCQDNGITNTNIRFEFNNYYVCNFSDNFKVYFFYVDTNNYFRVTEATTIEESISTDLDFANIELIEVIFQYEKYTLCFNRLGFFRDSLRQNNNLKFKIVKRNCYKKYIRKSYSKQYEQKRLGNYDLDISGNGKTDGIDTITVSDTWYRRRTFEHFKDGVRKHYYTFDNSKIRGVIEASYSVGCCYVRCKSYGYKNYKKFFIQNELYFRKLQSINGMSVEDIAPQTITKLREVIHYEEE